MGDTIAPSSLTPSVSPEAPQTSAESTSPPSPAEPTPAQSSAIAYLSTLLNRPLRLTATDGRTFIGPLICVDKASNVVLSPAEEFPPRIPSPGTPGTPADREAWLARRRHDVLWPKSESFDGPGRGWGGRPLAMILVEGDKIRKVELMDEDVMQGQTADRYT